MLQPQLGDTTISIVAGSTTNTAYFACADCTITYLKVTPSTDLGPLGRTYTINFEDHNGNICGGIDDLTANYEHNNVGIKIPPYYNPTRNRLECVCRITVQPHAYDDDDLVFTVSLTPEDKL